MARARKEPKQVMYVLPVDHSASPNEQMFGIAEPPEDGRTTMLATPGVPFTADSLGLSDEEFEKMVEANGLPFRRADDLGAMTRDDLEEAAKKEGVEGASSMRKDELVSALSKPVADEGGEG